MGSRGIPRITSPGGGGQGPPGPPGPDHFQPKYLVGNIPAGDDPVAYNMNGFTYIPDPGDGSGIAQALLAAQTDPGTVGIRRGTYDLNLPGSPTTPLSIPAGTTVQGMGPYITGTNPPAGQIVARTQGDQGVFSIDGNGSFVRDLMILVPESPPAAVFSGSDFITRIGPDGSGGYENVIVLSFGLPAASLVRAFFSVDNSNTAFYFRCFALHFTPSRLGSTPADWLCAWRVTQPSPVIAQIESCASLGQDVAIASFTPSSVIRIQEYLALSFNRRAVYQDSTAPGVISVDSSSVFIAGDVDAIGVELYPGSSASNYGSALLNSALIGTVGAMTGPAMKIHGVAGGAGYVRVLGNFMLWSANQGQAIIEVGDAGSATPCDRNLINSNQIRDQGGSANGVAVLDAANTSNSVQTNSIDVGGLPVVDAGTLTQIAGNV